MSQKYKNKNQHFIPETYLNSWIDQNRKPNESPFVWMFPKEFSHNSGKRKSPKNIFSQNNFYTVKDKNGTRNLKIEDWLNDIESRFSVLKKRVLDKKEYIPKKQRNDLIMFISALLCRTLAFRDFHIEQHQELLRKMETMSATEGFHSIPFFSSDASKGQSIEDIKRLIPNMAQTLITEMLPSLHFILNKMSINILYTDSEIGFITSDDPVIAYDPKAKPSVIISQNWLLSPTIEITCPISPYLLLLLTWKPLNDSTQYIKADGRLINEANRFSRAHCNEYIVVNQNLIEPYWFLEGNPLEESVKI